MVGLQKAKQADDFAVDLLRFGLSAMTNFTDIVAVPDDSTCLADVVIDSAVGRFFEPDHGPDCLVMKDILDLKELVVPSFPRGHSCFAGMKS